MGELSADIFIQTPLVLIMKDANWLNNKCITSDDVILR